jgi:hypothetical protein
MHLRGHDSNHVGSLLAVLEAFPEGVPEAALARCDPSRPRAGRLGNGEVQRAVTRALSAAGRPLHVAAIVELVEADLGREVSRESVKCCLMAGIRGATPLFERVERGSYGRSRLQ